MKRTRGRSEGGRTNTKKIVLPQNESFKCNPSDNENSKLPPSGIIVELSVSIDINELISGINGYVWASKDLQQVEIITNAIRVQNIEIEIVKAKLENSEMYLIKVINEKDIQNVLDFIQNDKSGLMLKPDWTYPEGERNKSFDQWTHI